MGTPLMTSPYLLSVKLCKNNDLSCCKNGLYEVIRPPLHLVILIHVLIHVKVISIVDDVIISTIGCNRKLGFASLKIYIKERPPSLFPLGNLAPLALGE